MNLSPAVGRNSRCQTDPGRRQRWRHRNGRRARQGSIAANRAVRRRTRRRANGADDQDDARPGKSGGAAVAVVGFDDSRGGQLITVRVSGWRRGVLPARPAAESPPAPRA